MTEDELQELGIRYRGTVLSYSANLEKYIEGYIAMYFTFKTDIAYEMCELVLDRLTFDSKIATFEAMLKKKYESDFKKRFGKLISEIRIIQSERNKFAHYHQSFDTGDIRNVVLCNYRNSRNYITLTHESFELLIKRIEKCAEIVQDMATDQWDVDASGSPYKP